MRINTKFVNRLNGYSIFLFFKACYQVITLNDLRRDIFLYIVIHFIYSEICAIFCFRVSSSGYGAIIA